MIFTSGKISKRQSDILVGSRFGSWLYSLHVNFCQESFPQ